jgi:hypothetical protein
VTNTVVTSARSVHSIGYMPLASARPHRAQAPARAGGSAPAGGAVDMLLTKRRAVDFCRVATAMCRRPALTHA